MKLKTLAVLLAASLFAACSSSDAPGGEPGSEGKTMPTPEVYAGIQNQGDLAKASMTRAAAAAEVTTDAYFFVRIDPSLNLRDSKGNLIRNTTYYPQPINSSSATMVEANKGTIYTDYPYASKPIQHMDKYVASSDGSATMNAIASVPDVANLLAIHANTSLANITPEAYNALKAANPNLHVIWYVVKKLNYGDLAWHVDGILTTKNTLKEIVDENPDMKFDELDQLEDKKVSKLEKQVIVDIHQQRHSNWGEIKTSLHIYDVHDITVTLPMALTDYNADVNSISVREFANSIDVATLNANFNANLKVTVSTERSQVLIKVTGITQQLLDAAEKRYEDGITVEVHTFTDFARNAQVWQCLKGATVTTQSKVKGAISSAFIATDTVTLNEYGNTK